MCNQGRLQNVEEGRFISAIIPATDDNRKCPGIARLARLCWYEGVDFPGIRIRKLNGSMAPLNPRVFCTLPFVHVNNRVDGKITACCHISEPTKKPNGEAFNIVEGDSLEDAFRSEFMRSLRVNMLTGVRDPRCSKCWMLEDIGNRSKRINDGNRYLMQLEDRHLQVDPPFEPMSWDVKLGSNCNLKCRMCDPFTSSALMREAAENGWIDVNQSRRHLQATVDLLRHPKFKAELERLVQYAREIYFLGGEPSLLRQHLDIADVAIRDGHAEKTTIRWSTNLTHFDDDFIDRARRFAKVTIDCSVDGFGEVNEYIRFGSRWSEIESRMERIRKALPEAEIKIVCTVQIYNVFNVERLAEWAGQWGVELAYNFLSWPNYLSSQCLPEELRQNLREKYHRAHPDRYRSLCNWLNRGEFTDAFAEFHSYTRKLDRVRGQNFLSLVPPEYREHFDLCVP